MNHNHIDSSISPVTQRDGAIPEASSEVKELVESEEMKNSEVTPVPDAHDEVRQPRVGRRPMAPTKAEIEEHYPLHLNFRSWCEHCCAGKARQDQHLIEPHDREKLGITFSADYAFLVPEEKEDDMQPSLVMFDDDKEAFWAIGVESKGPSEPVVKYVKGILDQSGYEGQKIAFKTDQEVSILALKKAIAAVRNGETVPIESPVRASKSNGKMEGAIGRWQAQLRTTKHYAEHKLGKKIEVSGVLFSWLIPYVTEIMNKFKLGTDGRTAYERITGHKCRHIAVGFAENVSFMLEPDKNNLHKAESRLMSGIFLGYVWRSTEYIVGTQDGIYKCRTIRRKNVENSYDASCFDFLKTTYNDYVMKDARTTVAVPRFPGGGGKPDEIPQRGRDFVPRRVYTRPTDYAKHGYTQGCRGCAWLETQMGPRVGHTEACRARLEKAIADDESDDRTKKAKDRADHYLGQQVEPDARDGGDPRPEGEPSFEVATPLKKSDHDTSADPAREEFDIGTPGRVSEDGMAIEEEELEDGPNAVSERRIQTPVRAPPTKRRVGVHDDEPDMKVVIRDDDEMGLSAVTRVVDHSGSRPNKARTGPIKGVEKTTYTKPGSSASLSKRKVLEVQCEQVSPESGPSHVSLVTEDEDIVCRAILGKNLHDIYSSERIKLAVERQSMEHIKEQVMRVDVMEVFDEHQEAMNDSVSVRDRLKRQGALVGEYQ